MPNGEYQSMLAAAGRRAPQRSWRARGGDRAKLARVLDAYPDDGLRALIGDLAGHDLGDVIAGLEACDAEPSGRA